MRTLVLGVVALLVGWTGGYLMGAARSAGPGGSSPATPPEAHRLPMRYGDLGPRLLDAGVIDVDRMAVELARRGAPMTEAQRRLLLVGGRDHVEISPGNGLFLLDFFWAVGLANRNPILTEGPMMALGKEQMVRFASTGGWRLGTKPVEELYAHLPLVPLTPDQLARLERVARAVYRPCCDNPAHFPDCNHGMAMLGMLTLLAGDGADEARMFEAAAAANAVWYPRQYRELAAWIEVTEDRETDEVEPRRLVSRELASGSGFQVVRRALSAAGMSRPAPGGAVSAC